MTEIGNKLAVCRQNKNMTQEELAGRLGVTSQAVSKWERNLSFPDITLLKDICTILEVSADYLLDVQDRKKNKEKEGNDQILYNLQNCQEALELLFGRDLVPLFLDGEFKKEIFALRLRLSQEGILLPVVRVRDEITSLQNNQFMVLSRGRILYEEEVWGEINLQYIIEKMEETICDKYGEILNPDMIKILIDNLKETYPALIEGVVPEKISYAMLTRTAKEFLKRGNSIAYLPQILEYMQYCLLDNPKATAEEILHTVMEGILQ